MCLEAALNTSDKKLQLGKCTKGVNQRFTSSIFPANIVGDLVYAATPAFGGSNCVGAAKADAAAVTKCVGDRDQLWEFTTGNEMRMNGTMCLTSTAGNAVQLIACSGNADQKWRYTANKELTVRPGGKASGQCLDFGGVNGLLALTACRPAEGRFQAYTSTIFTARSTSLDALNDTTGELQFCIDTGAATDPYHKATACVQSDGTSSVCIRETGSSSTQSSDGFLLNLLSPWHISADFDRESEVYHLVQPSLLLVNATTNGTIGQEFNLIADVTVLQFSAAVATTTAVGASEDDAVGRVQPFETGDTCCGPTEYRATTTTCQKFTAGSSPCSRATRVSRPAVKSKAPLQELHLLLVYCWLARNGL